MKKVIIIVLSIQCVFLSGCRTAMDASKAVAEAYQMPVTAVVQISAIAGVACDYQLSCTVGEDDSMVEIIKPDCLVGMKASIESDTCEIQYEDIVLDSLMLPLRGMTPVDCFDQTIYSLRKEVPLKYGYESRDGTDCLCLTFEREESGYQSVRTLWLKEDTLELMEGEYYLDGILVMRLKVMEMAFTGETAAE